MSARALNDGALAERRGSQMGSPWNEIVHAHRPLRRGSMSDQHGRRQSLTCIDAVNAVATQRKNSFSPSNVLSSIVPLTTSISLASRTLVPSSLLCMDATFDSATSDSPQQQEVPKTSPFRRMLTFGASVFTKVLTRAKTLPAPAHAELAATTLAAAGRSNSVGASVLTKISTRAETLPAPKSAGLAATTLAAAGRSNSAAAEPSPSSRLNRKLLPQLAAAASDWRFGARKAAERLKDVDGTVTGEQNSKVVMKSAFSMFICATCGQGYSSAGSLALHARVHQGEKPYVCPLCGEEFTSAAKLHLHNISERNGVRQKWGREKTARE